MAIFRKSADSGTIVTYTYQWSSNATKFIYLDIFEIFSDFESTLNICSNVGRWHVIDVKPKDHGVSRKTDIEVSININGIVSISGADRKSAEIAHRKVRLDSNYFMPIFFVSHLDIPKSQ